MFRDIGILTRNFAAPIRRVAEQVREVVILAVRGQYNTQGRRGPHGPGKPNKPETVARYAAINRRGFKVLNQWLRRTDALFQSEATRGAPHGIYEVDDDSMTMGTDLIYGRIQQDRGNYQYDLTDVDFRRIASIVKRGILKDVDNFFDYQPDFAEAAF